MRPIRPLPLRCGVAGGVRRPLVGGVRGTKVPR